MGSEKQTARPPISAELWQRFKALDHTCRLSICRDDQWLIAGAGGRFVWSGLRDGPRSAHRRIWRVRIIPRTNGPGYNIIDGEGTTLSDAIVSAVEQAERKGWSAQAHEPRLKLTE